ncbi:hypothetical protein ACEPAG_3937 [Sanghuangporus baumii]
MRQEEERTTLRHGSCQRTSFPRRDLILHPSQPQTEVARQLTMDGASEAIRVEFALDLVVVLFQVCHTRLPLFSPIQFLSRLEYASFPGPETTLEKPLHPAFASGLTGDRHIGRKVFRASPARYRRQGADGQSRLVRMLVMRVHDAAEAGKIYWISTLDHIVIALLIELL